MTLIRVNSLFRTQRLAPLVLATALLLGCNGTTDLPRDRALSDSVGPDSGPIVSRALDDGSIFAQMGDLQLTGIAGTMRPGAAASIDIAETHAPFPIGFTPASDVFDILIPAGSLNGPLELRFKRPRGEGRLVSLHQASSKRWAIEAVTLEGDLALVSTASFSNRVIGFLDDFLDWSLDEMTGTTEPCLPTPTPPDWATSTGAPASGIVHTCLVRNLDGEGREVAELQIKSNRAEFLKVSWTGDATIEYVWVENQDGATRKLLRNWMGIGDNQVLLEPGKTMTLGLLRPTGPSRSLSFTLQHDNSTIVASLAHELTGKIDSLVPLVAVIAACSGGSVSAEAFFEPRSPAPLTVDELRECGLEAIRESATLLADELVRLGDKGLATGDFSAEEMKLLFHSTPKVQLAASVLKDLTGLVEATSWASKSLIYFIDVSESFAANANEIYFDVVGAPSDSTVGPVVLTLAEDGTAPVALGTDSETAIATVAGSLGQPDEDTGWMPSPEGYPCFYRELRIVRWGQFRMIFANDAMDPQDVADHELVLYDYSALPGINKPPFNSEPRIATDRGLELGDTIDDALEMYPGSEWGPSELGDNFVSFAGTKMGGMLTQEAPYRLTVLWIGQYPCED